MVPKLKAMLERGERPTQACVMPGSTFVAHNVALLGAETVWIDLEHGPATIASLCDLVMAVGQTAVPSCGCLPSTAGSWRRQSWAPVSPA